MNVCLTQVVVVQAISALCQKYPRKHGVLMNFLFTMLREEVKVGGKQGMPGLLVLGMTRLLALCQFRCTQINLTGSISWFLWPFKLLMN